MSLGTWSAISTNFTENVTIPAGADRIATLFTAIEWTSLPTFTTPTVGGVPMLLAGMAHSTNGAGREVTTALWYLLEEDMPANGTQSRVWGTSGGAGVQGRAAVFAVHTDREQEAPTVAKYEGAATASMPLGPLDHIADTYGVAACGRAANVLSAMSAGWDERFDGPGSSSDTSLSGGDRVFATTDDETVTFTHTSNISSGIFATLAPLATGPTITGQPAAATALVAPSVPGVFTLAYELTGAWVGSRAEVNDGGGYDPLTPGGIYTLEDDEEGLLTLAVAPTALTQDGFSFKLFVEDENGESESDPAVLTVLNGYVLTQAVTTTDGSAQVTADGVTDYTCADGEAFRLKLVRNGETLARCHVVGLAP